MGQCVSQPRTLDGEAGPAEETGLSDEVPTSGNGPPKVGADGGIPQAAESASGTPSSSSHPSLGGSAGVHRSLVKPQQYSGAVHAKGTDWTEVPLEDAEGYVSRRLQHAAGPSPHACSGATPSFGPSRASSAGSDLVQILRDGTQSGALPATGALDLETSAPTQLSADDLSRGAALMASMSGAPHDLVRFGTPRARNEEARLATVRALGHMAMASCSRMDALLALICGIWGAPVSSVTMIDSDHVWMCNAHGTETGHREWQAAMCPWTLLTPNPVALAVSDLTTDARFHGNVHCSAGIRAYLTAPLVASNGHRLGAICFVDKTPRKFSSGDCRLMANFAELAVRELERHVRLAERLKRSGPNSGEDALPRLFAKPLRNIDEVVDTCVVLVDTGVPGWQLMYADESWAEWTGVGRDACVGKTLDEVLENVHGDPGAKVIWEPMLRAATERRAFVTSKVRVRASAAGGIPASMRYSFYLAFKAAGAEPLDADTIPVGVPAYLPPDIDSPSCPKVGGLYFARLHVVPDPPPNTAVNTGMANVVTGAGGAARGRAHLLNAVTKQLELLSPMTAAEQLFKGLRVACMLGQGCFGTVWRATWHGASVALKVADMELEGPDDAARAQAEVAIGLAAQHVNVVRTLAHGSSKGDAPGSNRASLDASHIVVPASMNPTTSRGQLMFAFSSRVDIQPSVVLPDVEEGIEVVPVLQGPPLLQATESAPSAVGASGAAAAALSVRQLAREGSGSGGGGGTVARNPSSGRRKSVTFLQGGDDLGRLCPSPSPAPTTRPSTPGQFLESLTQQPDPWTGTTAGGQGGGGLATTASSECPQNLLRSESAAQLPRHPLINMPEYVAPTWHVVSMCSGAEGYGGDGRLSTDQIAGSGPFARHTSSVHGGTARLAGASNALNTLPTCWHAMDTMVGTATSAAISVTSTPAYPTRLRQWMILEFCDGGSLADLIDRGGLRVRQTPTSPPRLPHVVHNARDIARALAYLHDSMRVVHGDLTAFNVLLAGVSSAPHGDTRGYMCKVSDFGMCHKLGEASKEEVVATYGSITHMAPEVLTDKRLGFKADVWSLGVIIWQMVTGSRPWAGLNNLQLAVAVGMEGHRLQWAVQQPGSLGEAVVALAERCMAPTPEARPSAAALVSELDALCDRITSGGWAHQE